MPLIAEVGRQEPGLVDESVRSLELVLDHTGTFEFTGGDVDSISPGRVVLDPAYRLPNHRPEDHQAACWNEADVRNNASLCRPRIH